MTVAEMARQLDVSTMTIYRRLKREGLNIKDFRDGDTNILTSEGVSVIGQLFATTRPSQAVTDSTTDDATQAQPVAQPDAQPDVVALAVLRERVRGLEDKLEAVEAERDRLREQVDTLTAMLQSEQAQRVRLLEGGQRRGLFGWLRRRGE